MDKALEMVNTGSLYPRCCEIIKLYDDCHITKEEAIQRYGDLAQEYFRSPSRKWDGWAKIAAELFDYYHAHSKDSKACGTPL